MSSHAPPGTKRRELAREQAIVDRVHLRVAELRRLAEHQRIAAEADRSGSTFQARYERDVAAYHHARRQRRFTFGDEEPLVFGRLDLGDGQTAHVGRVSVMDDGGRSLLVDWRAPLASAFYRATAAEPLGVARRRTLSCRGAQVRDLDDEILDVDAAERLGLEAVTGQGALLASLTRARTGRMRDIVATIQADQDRIIRLPATGTLIVSGGPGTGKTVVALHRVAFLLYTNRQRFEQRGVLVVGPTPVFTRYIGRVLPSLGEERAVLRSVADLAEPPFEVRAWDPPDLARIKGGGSMAEVCRRAVRAALPPVREPVQLTRLDTTATVHPRGLEGIRDRVWRRTRPADADWRGGYLGRREAVEDAVVSALWSAWRRTRKAERRPIPEDRAEAGFDRTLRESTLVEELVAQLWPPLRADRVLDALTTGAIDLGAIAGDVLSHADLDRLRVAWNDPGRGPSTVDDVALFDELDHLVGRRPAPPRPDATDDGIQLSTDREEPIVELPRVEHHDYRDFAHIVVDEAQDLSPMQWRMVARRGPFASWTVVGDLAQRSRVAGPASWGEVAAIIGRRHTLIERLTVNYRTPAEVVDVARAILAAGGEDPAIAPEAVRSAGTRPGLVRADDVPATAVAFALEDASRRDGTVAVIAPVAEVALVTARLEDALHDHPDPVRADLADRTTVFDPRTVKGLEFDTVVVAHPDRIAAEPGIGHHQLYVAVTRTTGRLLLVADPRAEVPGSDLLEERAAA